MVNSPKFKIWLNKQIWLNGKSPEQKVREDLEPQNLKVEVFENGTWRRAGLYDKLKGN